MPHYVVLVNFTDQGVRNIRELPKLIETNTKRLAETGIKVTRYFTLGAYDIVGIFEAPSDEAMMSATAAIGSQGNIRTTTMRAFTEKEFLQMLKELPAPGAAARGAPPRGRARR